MFLIGDRDYAEEALVGHNWDGGQITLLKNCEQKTATNSTWQSDMEGKRRGLYLGVDNWRLLKKKKNIITKKKKQKNMSVYFNSVLWEAAFCRQFCIYVKRQKYKVKVSIV